MSDHDLNYLLDTTDATVWADAFIEVVIDGELDIDADLMTTWFANAMGAVDMNQTFANAVQQATNRAAFQSVIKASGAGRREFALAKTKLDEALMWFNRGMMLTKDIPDTPDLERLEEGTVVV